MGAYTQARYTLNSADYLWLLGGWMPARGADLSNTLTMLHNTVMHTGKDLREALTQGVEQLQVSGQASQVETRKSVVDELSRMRTDLRETKNRMVLSLNEEVRQAVVRIRQDVQTLATAVGELTEASSPLVSAGGVPAPADPHEASSPVPVQRSGDGAALGEASPEQPVQEAAGGVSAAQPTVLRESSKAADGTVAGSELLAAVREEIRAQLGAVASELREHLDTAQGQWSAELASVRREVAAVATVLQECGDKAVTEVTEEHSALLRQAARVSSAVLLCHRDTWGFITAHAGRHPHFRVPPQVTDTGHERVRADLSGRSLIALLISLFSIQGTAREGDGDRELAGTLYERIRDSLTGLTPHGQPVTIILDDRVPYPDEAGSGAGQELTAGMATTANKHQRSPGDEGWDVQSAAAEGR